MVNNIEACVHGINIRLKASFDTFENDAREYIRKLNAILQEMEGTEGELLEVKNESLKNGEA